MTVRELKRLDRQLVRFDVPALGEFREALAAFEATPVRVVLEQLGLDARRQRPSR